MNSYSSPENAYPRSVSSSLSNCPYVEFDTTSNCHVSGNISGFYYASSKENIASSVGNTSEKTIGRSRVANERRRREI